MEKVYRAQKEGELLFSSMSYALAFESEDILLISALMMNLADSAEVNTDVLEALELIDIIKANNSSTADILYKGMIEAPPDALLVEIPKVYN